MTYYVAEHVMVHPFQMMDNVGESRGRNSKERDSRSGETHGQMEVCLNENGFLRSGQFKCPNSARRSLPDVWKRDHVGGDYF